MPRADGIGPMIEPPPYPRSSSSSDDRLPSESGSEPDKMFPLRLRNSRFGKSSMIAGIGPSRLLPSRSMAVTVFPPASQVTPNQLHSLPTGPSQLLLSYQKAPLVEVNSASSAVRSGAGISANVGAAAARSTAANKTAA